MRRSRWKLMAGAAGLTLLVGCMNLSEHRWFERFRSRDDCATPCCLEPSPCCEGTLMSESGPLLPPPSPGGFDAQGGAPVAPAPIAVGPVPTSPPPGQRLVPQPQPHQLQPTPFNPNQPPR